MQASLYTMWKCCAATLRTSRRKPLLWLCSVALLLSAGAVTFGQSATTSLRGVVKDPSGALVPGASITLTDTGTGNSYHAATNASGYYIFPTVTPARYLITLNSNGFATQTRSAELLVDQPATINFTLSVQANTVTVDVSSSAETLNFTDASMGNSVGNTTIEALPMDGRNPINLLSLQPGVLYMGSEVSDSRQGAVSGSRSDQGNITLDGLDDNDQIFGTAFTGILRSTLDSTEEFRVTTSNGTAAAGRSSGAEINLVTKSGTNHEHGSLYEYYRPTNTVANQFFLKNQQLTSDEPNIPQKYIVNTFGGSIGGRIVKDKLFYFFNYEGQRIGTATPIEATVPTPTFMAGELQYQDANTGGTDTLTTAQVAAMDAPCESNTFNGQPVCPNGPGPNAAVLSYLKGVPTSTNPVGGDGGYNSAAYFFASPTPSTLNTSILKFDYLPNSKHHIFVRGNLQKDTASGAENLPGQPASTFYDDNTKGLAAGDTWIPTSHIVNDIRYGFIRQGYQNGGIAPGNWVSFSGLTQPTAQTGSNLLHVPVNNITDTLTWNKGLHTFAFGANWRGITNHHSNSDASYGSASTDFLQANATGLPTPANMAGSFSNSWAQAWANEMGVITFAAQPFNYTITSPTSAVPLATDAPVVRNFHSNEWEGYAQDTWHARPNLTITYGLRYTLLQTPYETNGQQLSYTNDMVGWMLKRESEAQQGIVYNPSLSEAPSGKANHAPGFWPEQKKNFAPRIGLVWSPDARTSVRASAGMYYDHYGESIVNTWDTSGVGEFGLSGSAISPTDEYGLEQLPRFTGAHNIPDFGLAAPPSPLTYPYVLPYAPYGIYLGMDNRMKTPYAYSFNASLQHQWGHGFTFEEAYVGRLGRHLIQELDQAEPVDYVDPAGGGDYFSNAAILSKAVDEAPFVNGVKTNNNIPAIPYFEHIFSYMANSDYAGESATQAIFNDLWAPERYTNGETYALLILDLDNPTGQHFYANQAGSLYALSSIGNSSYNALQFTLRHPAYHGLTVDFGYTFSKSIDFGSEAERSNIFTNTDDGFTNFAIQNTWNPKLNKGPSDFDTHSLMTADWVYALPVGRGKAVLGGINRVGDAFLGGWQWAGLWRWTSGLPFSLDSPAFPTNWDNPAMSFNVGNVRTHRNFQNGIPHAFDSATVNNINNGIYYGQYIRLPYAGEAGSRNNFRGDGYFDIDSSLSKTWGLGEWAKLKFAAEAFNITNTVRMDPSLNGLVAHTGNATLGTYDAPLSTYRRMQFSLRVDF